MKMLDSPSMNFDTKRIAVDIALGTTDGYPFVILSEFRKKNVKAADQLQTLQKLRSATHRIYRRGMFCRRI
jgi:hypothetical protein